jgi:hypothetical protein
MTSFTRQRAARSALEASTPGRTAAMTDCGASGRSTTTRRGHGPWGAGGTSGGGAGIAGAFHDANASSSSSASASFVTSPTQTSVARSGRHSAP